eukprot:m.292648 g.292648  ORF g.292648 m.292648 type:complete len:941 (+) comp12654_c0_seq1:211-3033(+)
MDWDTMLQRGPVGHGIVKFDYVATNEDELTLVAGDRVVIYSKDEAEVEDIGWWFGKIGGRVGVFPMNYVVEEDPVEAARRAAEEQQEVEGSAAAASAFPTSRLSAIPQEAVKVLRCIGSGGFGRVHLGRYNHQLVAVKVLTSNGLSPEELEQKAQELRAEGDLLAMCAHINITKVYGACVAPPKFYLVMEYAHGGALSTLLRRVKLPPNVILDWATQIAKGMNYLHNDSPVSVVHRDLKSSNILIASAGPDGEPILENNTLKITDFGLARTFTKTTQVTTAGTFAWMAPEVIRTSTFSKGSDVWSYGVLLWELLTSQVPYHGIHMMTIAYSVVVKGCTLPIPSQCPAPFESLMHQCWLPESSGRPSFSNILFTLQNPQLDFPKTTRNSFRDLQDTWVEEITLKFQELERTEQNVQEQQSELEKNRRQQERQAKELSEKQRQLELLEMELQQRERVMLENQNSVQRPNPVKRNQFRIKTPFHKKKSKQLKKSDIGEPTDFRHVRHVGPNQSMLGPSYPSGLRSPVSPLATSPLAASPRSASPAGPAVQRLAHSPCATWSCSKCTFINSVLDDFCSMCEHPGEHAMPVPPQRAKPPSLASISPDRRRSRADADRRSSTSSNPRTPVPLSRADSIVSDDSPSSRGSANPFAASVMASMAAAASSSASSPSTPTPRSVARTPTLVSPPVGKTRIPSAPSSVGRPSNSSLTPMDSCEYETGGSAFSPARPVRNTQMMTKSPPQRSSSTSQADQRTPDRRLLRRVTLGTGFGNPFLPDVPDEPVIDPASTVPRWLKPNMTHEEAIEYLRNRPKGHFVIRGRRSQPNKFAICVVHEGPTLWNNVILRSEEGWHLGAEGRMHFGTLSELVKHFSTFPYTLSQEGEWCTLSADVASHVEPTSRPHEFRTRPRSHSESRISQSSTDFVEAWEQEFFGAAGAAPVNDDSTV